MGARPHLIVACALLLAVYLAPAGADEALSPELLTVFRRLDELGRDAVADARLVELRYREVLTSRGARERSKEGWLLDGDDEGLTLLYEDLLPWRYPKGKPVLVPASWHPDLIEVAEVRAADFEAVLVGLAKPLPEPGSQEWMEADRPWPMDKGRRLLAAHAA